MEVNNEISIKEWLKVGFYIREFKKPGVIDTKSLYCINNIDF